MRDWCRKSRCLTGHHGQQQLRDDASRLFECAGLLSAMGEGYRGEEWGGGRREEWSGLAAVSLLEKASFPLRSCSETFVLQGVVAAIDGSAKHAC